MSDNQNLPAKTDWTGVNNIVQKRAVADSLPIDLPASEAGGLQKPDSGKTVQPEGVIASFKANTITRKAAIEHLKVYYEKQLEAARHHLTEVVRVRKAGSTAVAEQMLASINSQQMQFLVEVGLRNEGVRHRALMQLNDQVAQTLRDIQNADWPDALREQAVTGVLDRQRKFFERLMTDLGEV